MFITWSEYLLYDLIAQNHLHGYSLLQQTSLIHLRVFGLVLVFLFVWNLFPHTSVRDLSASVALPEATVLSPRGEAEQVFYSVGTAQQQSNVLCPIAAENTWWAPCGRRGCIRAGAFLGRQDLQTQGQICHSLSGCISVFSGILCYPLQGSQKTFVAHL